MENSNNDEIALPPTVKASLYRGLSGTGEERDSESQRDETRCIAAPTSPTVQGLPAKNIVARYVEDDDSTTEAIPAAQTAAPSLPGAFRGGLSSMQPSNDASLLLSSESNTMHANAKEDENSPTDTDMADQQDVESCKVHNDLSPNCSEEDQVPIPLQLQRHVRQALPGAHPHVGINSSSDAMQTLSEEVPASTIEGVTANQGLVAARLISMENLEVAEPMGPSSTETQGIIQERKKTKFVVLCMLGGLSFFVGLVVYFVAKNSKNSADMQQTNAPSTAPTQEPLLDLLPASTQKVIQADTQSPQSQAYQWLLADPQFCKYSDARVVQRFAMATLFYATNGPKWKHKGGETVEVMLVHGGNSGACPPGTVGPNLPTGQPPGFGGDGGPPGGGRPPSQGSGSPGGGRPPGGGGPAASFLGSQKPKYFNVSRAEWLDHKAHECDWFSKSFDTMCPEDNQTIVSIIMVDNWLAGSLPPELGLLSSLQELFVSSNDVGGRLVTEIGTLMNLQRLELAGNKFTGTIPSEIGQLSNVLARFQILDNEFSGTLPKEFWRLSQLYLLGMGRNTFSGTLPSNLSGLIPGLREFHLQGNQFSGSLPTSIGHWTHLQHLNARKNKLTGQIPSELGLLATLAELRLQQNHFLGTLPSELGGLLSLDRLLLRGNDGLSGSLPSELGLLSGKLLEVDIQGTSIAGTIPSSLCYMETNSSRLDHNTQLIFDCSPTLCGCSCPCFNFNNSTY